LQEASLKDPTLFESTSTSNNALEYGNKMIDYIYEKIITQVEESRIELKERFKEAYKVNYRNTIEKKANNFLL
jgi:hypothetical protein